MLDKSKYKSNLRSILPSVMKAGADDLLREQKVLGSDLSAHSTITKAKLSMSRYSLFGQTNNEVAIIRDYNTNKLVGLHQLRERGVKSPFHGRYLQASEHTLVAPLHEGDLFEFICDLQEQEEPCRLSTEAIRNLFGQLVLAVEALHDKNIVHNDLKPENVLTTNVNYMSVPQLSLIDWDDISVVNDDGIVEDESEMVAGKYSRGWASIEKERYLVARKMEDSLLAEGMSKEYVQQYLQHYMGIDQPTLPNSKSNDCFALGCILYCLFVGDNDLVQAIQGALGGASRDIGTDNINLYKHCLNYYRDYVSDEYEKIEEIIAKDPSRYVEGSWRLALTDMLFYLIADEPDRLTVKQIKDHGFFGNTPDQRAQFFANLQEGYENKNQLQEIRADLRECTNPDESTKLIVELQQAHKHDIQVQSQFQVNGYHHDGSLQADNNFYLLPEAIQDLYVDIEDIDTLAEYFIANGSVRDSQEHECLIRKIGKAIKDISSLRVGSQYENHNDWMDSLSGELTLLLKEFSEEKRDVHSVELSEPENIAPNQSSAIVNEQAPFPSM